MYVTWGLFQFRPYEATLAMDVSIRYSDRGFPIQNDVVFNIQGEVCEADQYATNARLVEIRDAFSYNYQDIALRHDNGTPTVHSLANNDPNALTGNKIVGAWYPQTEEGEFVSGRKFNIRIQASLKLTGISNVLNYKDSLVFTGNAGPQWVWRRSRWWGYYAEIVSPNSLQKIAHKGIKVTADTWHLPPTPFYEPPKEKNTERVVRLGDPIVYPFGMTAFPTEWEYHYEIPFSADLLRPRTGYL